MYWVLSVEESERGGFVSTLCTCSSGFSLYDRQFHMLDLDSNEKKINLANDHIPEMISRVEKSSYYYYYISHVRITITLTYCTQTLCEDNPQCPLPF